MKKNQKPENESQKSRQTERSPDKDYLKEMQYRFDLEETKVPMNFMEDLR